MSFAPDYSPPPVSDLGNLSGAVSLSVTAGADYTATVTGNITAFALTLSRTGRIGITMSNASGYSVAQPTMTGRTAKLLSSTAWADAADALVKVLVEDDGTYLISSASALA